jgi:hypothetical protein
LAELAVLLAQADFGNLLHVYVHPGGRVELLPGDIGLPAMRERMLGEKFNLFGPTVAGYRLAAYRALPEGWSPAPPDVWVDLHMWRKFLRMENLVFATRAAVTAIVFATPQRHDLTLAEREVENRTYLERIRDPMSRNEIVAAAWHSLLSRDLQTERQVLVLGAARDGLVAELARTGGQLAAQELEVDRLLQSNGELAAGLERAGALLAAQELEADRLLRSNRELSAELARATALAAASAHEIDHMLGSRSWRLTAPLRKSFAVAARLYGSLRRA